MCTVSQESAKVEDPKLKVIAWLGDGKETS